MIILSPGPANISDRVRNAMLLPDICHRDQEFTKLITDIREQLLAVCNVSGGYRSVVYSGSGTLAIESALSALAGWHRKVLIIANGVYGERAETICRVFGVPHTTLTWDWGQMPDLSQVKAAARQSEIGAIYLVHHETTTGLLNPLQEIAQIARESKTLMLADAVSSVAGEELELDDWKVDMITGSANKCIRGVPGASFTVVSQRFIDTISQCRSGGYYAGFLKHLEAEEKGFPPFTPAVHTYYAFREALTELLEEGVDNRIEHYRQIAESLREGLAELGLSFHIPPTLMSNTMTTVNMPGGWDYERLHAACRQKGYIIYQSQGHLARTTFRLGTVGRISMADIKGFIQSLGAVLSTGRDR